MLYCNMCLFFLYGGIHIEKGNIERRMEGNGTPVSKRISASWKLVCAGLRVSVGYSAGEK
ncbi:hypothetical protein EMIT040CA3_10493 [Bacillus pseudomycoides]